MILDRHPSMPGNPKWAGKKFLGYWYMDEAHINPANTYAEFLYSLPDPRDFVDPTWDAAERAMVLDHLRVATTFGAWKGISGCRICECSNGSRCLTFDGSWVFPQGLAHYVETHGVRLPQEFVDHVRALPPALVAELRLHAERTAAVLADYEQAKDVSRCATRGVTCHSDAISACVQVTHEGRSRRGAPHCWVTSDALYAALRSEEARHDEALGALGVRAGGHA